MPLIEDDEPQPDPEFYTHAHVAAARKILKSRLLFYWITFGVLVLMFATLSFMQFGSIGSVAGSKLGPCVEAIMPLLGAIVCGFYINRVYAFIDNMLAMKAQRVVLNIPDPGAGKDNVTSITIKFDGTDFVLPMEFRKEFPFGQPTKVTFVETIGPIPFPPHIIVGFEKPELKF